jgi:glutaredoxin
MRFGVGHNVLLPRVQPGFGSDGNMRVLQLLLTPGCVDCGAMRIMLRRIGPDYSDVQVEEVDASGRLDLETRYGLFGRPAVLIDGVVMAKSHVREAGVRRLLQIRRRRSKRVPPSS